MILIATLKYHWITGLMERNKLILRIRMKDIYEREQCISVTINWIYILKLKDSLVIEVIGCDNPVYRKKNKFSWKIHL